MSAHRAGRAALVGRTNVGKSTLLNRLVEEKISIVSASAQTTRNRIVGVRTLPEAQIAFIDTPGIHKPKHRMNRIMVTTAIETTQGADVVLFIVDAADGIGPGDRYIARVLSARVSGPPVIMVLNKVDLLKKERLLPLIGQAVAEWGFDEHVPLSALRGDNCDRLLEVIISKLPPAPAMFSEDTLTDQGSRRLVGEFVREKILRQVRQELPHETAVFVERWNEREDGLVEIDAVILCERDSQKAILIGRGGGVLKRVGTDARLEAEALLGVRIMLRLHVKVVAGWREDPAILREMGIEEA